MPAYQKPDWWTNNNNDIEHLHFYLAINIYNELKEDNKSAIKTFLTSFKNADSLKVYHNPSPINRSGAEGEYDKLALLYKNSGVETILPSIRFNAVKAPFKINLGNTFSYSVWNKNINTAFNQSHPNWDFLSSIYKSDFFVLTDRYAFSLNRAGNGLDNLALNELKPLISKCNTRANSKAKFVILTSSTQLINSDRALTKRKIKECIDSWATDCQNLIFYHNFLDDDQSHNRKIFTQYQILTSDTSFHSFYILRQPNIILTLNLYVKEVFAPHAAYLKLLVDYETSNPQ